MQSSEGSRGRSSDENRRRFGEGANSTSSEHKVMTQEPSSPQDDAMNELLARLNSAMNIEPTHMQPEPSTSNDLSSHLLDSDQSLTENSALSAVKKTSSVYTSSSTLQDTEELDRSLVETPTPSQASTSQDFTFSILDSGSTESTRMLESAKEKEENRTRPRRREEKPANPSKKEIMPWYKKKKGKIPNKSEMEKWQKELDMWNASDSTVLEHLLNNKGSVGKWQAVATARGLCSLSNGCRCADCQSSYVTFDNDGDGGMTEMAVGACHLLSNKGHVSKWQAVATARGLCSLSDNCRCPDCQSSYVTFDNDGDGGMSAGVPLYSIMTPPCSIQ